MTRTDISPDVFGCSEFSGFLPDLDPVTRLAWLKNNPGLVVGQDWWLELACNLPSFILAGTVYKTVESFHPFPVDALFRNVLYRQRAMQMLSFIGSACVYEQKTNQRNIPRSLAMPWCELAERLGRPPILSYESYISYNWRRSNLLQSFSLDNIQPIQCFDGGTDEAWFILIHVAIEAFAGKPIHMLFRAREAAMASKFDEVQDFLEKAAEALPLLVATLKRMREHCDPYIYYTRVRPFLFGWKDNPAIPRGVIYEGCFNDAPQYFRGETGAQSCIIPVLDALLGVTHEECPLTTYLHDMRNYMSTVQREFLLELEKHNQILRDYVKTNQQLWRVYNSCVQSITYFRMLHLKFAEEYISNQQEETGNSTGVGTGGTPYLEYLQKHIQETEKHLL